MPPVRTFIAFDTPPGVRSAVAALQAEFRDSGADVRWESTNKFHVTVKFLGDVQDADLHGIFEDTRSACASIRQIPVIYRGVGAFPTLRRPKVLWIGCTNEDGSLERLKETLDAALLARGFPVEDRPFQPHVTLGRIRTARGLGNLTPKVEKCTFEPRAGIISEILVMKSVLRPLGAEYTVLTSIHLQS